MKNLLLTTIILTFAISAIPVVAQEVDDGFLTPDFEEELIITLTPKSPAPFSPFTIRVENHLLDLRRSLIKWEVDGVLVAEEIGKQTLTLTSKGSGVPSRISITAIDINDEKAVGQIEIRPGNVDLIWEAETYTPPFYRGKSLNTSESQIKIVAIPHFRNKEGGILSKNEVIFEWETEKGVDIEASGLGKNTYRATSDKVYRQRSVTVHASSLDRSYSATKSVNLAIHQPEIVFYKENPLTGVDFAKALSSNTSFENEEITLFVAPFFWSTGSPTSPAMDYRWEVGGRSFEENSNRITLRREGEGGNSFVEVFIDRAGKIFQKNSRGIKLSF